MALFARKLRMPSPRGGAARAQRRACRFPRGTSSRAHRSSRRSRDGLERAMFGMGCFWGAEKKFWQRRGVYTTAVGYAGGHTPEPDLRGGVLRPHRATPRSCSSSSTRSAPATSAMLRVFWENHDPTQGMRQGNDVGTQYRSGIYYVRPRRSARRPRRRATRTSARSRRRGYGAITTEIAAGARVLLRRGLPPAVPGEEPRRLLRAGRDGRELPRRASSRRR